MTASYSGVKLSSINGHLICGLCGGYLIDATVLTECIHVFCRSCILKYLLENKICPLCQSLVQETRPGQALRPDVALQRIVYKLVPGLLKTEMKRISEFKDSYTKDSCADKFIFGKEILRRNSNPSGVCSYAASDLCPSPLPTALATRSLSKSPCGLVSATQTTQMVVSNRLPSSAAFLLADDEFVSLSLTHLTSLPTYSKVSESVISKRHDYLIGAKANLKVESSHSQQPPSLRLTNSIYLLCPAVVTVANLHHLLLSKYQLDPTRQIVDLYLDGECLEPSHSLREVAFLYSFPTRHQCMCLQFVFTEACSAWWGTPMPHLERLQPKRSASFKDHYNDSNSVNVCLSSLNHATKLYQTSNKNKKRASF
ncbi:unnamed protein product [Heterobilharzia americana]|nr:unnamed protein product [Heterobilharzia americana]